jgi:predicted deacylase
MHVRELVVDLGDDHLAIPYVRVQGTAGDGPHLTVIAGVHGTEYTSIAAARAWAAELRADELSGQVTVVPVVNLPAFWARSPFVVPLDGKNLNRSFPGDADGSAAERLAAAVTETFIAGSDQLLDLHAGDLPEALEPFTLYDESPVADRARELALGYGLGHVVRQAASQQTVGGSTSAVAAGLGIPAITAESGQCGILDRASVDRHLRGLRNVARILGLAPGDVETFPAPVEHDSWVWLRTEAAGWWQPVVETGEGVAEGALLGTVAPILGGEATEIHAPAAGVPLFVTSSPAVTPDGLLMGLALT